MKKASQFGVISIALLLIMDAGCGGPQTVSWPPSYNRSNENGELATSLPGAASPDEILELSAPSERDAAASEQFFLLERLLKFESASKKMDIVADPNQRPIRIWINEGGSGVRAIHIVGHADGECCPLISEAVQHVGDRAEFSDAWFSYGYGDFTADNPAKEQELEKLWRELEARSRRQECIGQVIIKSTRGGDPIVEGSIALSNTARKAYQHAAAMDRPLLVWHDFNDYPRIVPALIVEGNMLKPLEFVIPNHLLAIPLSVKAGLSMDGIGQGIATLQAEAATIQEFMQNANLLISPFVTGWETNYRDLKMLPTLAKANARISSAIALWSGQPATNSVKSIMLKKLRELQEMNKDAERKITLLPLSPISDRRTIIRYGDVKQNLSQFNEFNNMLAKIQGALGRLQAMAKKPKARPEPVLTDAFLRGWPASFSSAKAETDFDDWAVKRQRIVWHTIRQNLSNNGVSFGTGPNGAPPELMLSNVVFRVWAEGDTMRVIPYFILAGAVALVADPQAKVVRYEATAADQNLIPIGGNVQGAAQ